MIYPSSSVRALPQKDGMGFNCEEEGGGKMLAVLGLLHSCQEGSKALEMHHCHHYA